jgi:hypothetical protein
MKHLFTLTEQERNRILGLHKILNKTIKEQSDVTVGDLGVGYGRMFRGKNPTGVEYGTNPRSKFLYNQIKDFCKPDNVKLYGEPRNPHHLINFVRFMKDYIYDTANNYDPKAAASDILRQLKDTIVNGADLCYLNNYLIKNENIPSGFHGLLSSNTRVPINWDEVFKALQGARFAAWCMIYPDDSSCRLYTDKPENSEVDKSNVDEPKKTEKEVSDLNRATLYQILKKVGIDSADLNKRSNNKLTDSDLQSIYNFLNK